VVQMLGDHHNTIVHEQRGSYAALIVEPPYFVVQV
jgi:hypothetical protein